MFGFFSVTLECLGLSALIQASQASKPLQGVITLQLPLLYPQSDTYKDNLSFFSHLILNQ